MNLFLAQTEAGALTGLAGLSPQTSASPTAWPKGPVPEKTDLPQLGRLKLLGVATAVGLTFWASTIAANAARPPQAGDTPKGWSMPTPSALIPVQMQDIEAWAARHIRAGDTLEHLIDVCGSPEQSHVVHKVIGKIDYGLCDLYEWGIDEYGNSSIKAFVLRREFVFWDAGEICEIMETVANPHANAGNYGATGVIYTFLSPANGGEIRLCYFLPPEQGSEVCP